MFVGTLEADDSLSYEPKLFPETAFMITLELFLIGCLIAMGVLGFPEYLFGGVKALAATFCLTFCRMGFFSLV